MRIWHFELLPYLPDLQFKGQLRELVAIMHDWKNLGKTNHLLINRIMNYPKSELYIYFKLYSDIYKDRYNKIINKKYNDEFENFKKGSEILYPENGTLFEGWHNKEYLRVCMSNLYEKYKFGIGKSKITDKEWNTLIKGYKNITGENYII